MYPNIFPKTHIFAFILVIAFIAKGSHQFVTPFDPDESKSISELVSSHGFVLQEYHVLTEDGYILTVHRVVPPDFDPRDYNVFRKPGKK